MTTRTQTIRTTFTTTTIAAALCASLFTAPAVANTQVRLKSSSDAASFSEGYALSVEAWSAQTRSARSSRPSGFNHQSHDRSQVWITDIGTLLFDDQDGDGYHSGFSVTIDVDSEYGDTEVYAKIYLEPTDSALTLLHKTGRFSVYGSTIGDEYRVDTELRSNYAADDYNITIDIHDAWSDQLLDTANSRGFTNLKQLPLESSDLNLPNHYSPNNDDADYGDSDHGENHNDSSDTVVTEYAGAFHPLLWLALMGGALLRRHRD